MRIPVTRSSMPPFEEYCAEIASLWDTRILTNNGEKSLRLSEQLCDYLQVPSCTLFANGHLALESLLRAMKLSGEVITTPFTFASTTHALVRCGLTPVFGDVREEDYTLDPSGIEKLITPRTCAILPVHVYGCLCDVEALQTIADRHGIPVIYDAAHAFGVTKNGVSAASFGYASMFSFHATKVFHTVEGGAVVTRDSDLVRALELERNYGLETQEDAVLPGGNAKMSEFHAAMGLCNLRTLPDALARRRALCSHYESLLSSQKGLRLPPKQPGVESNSIYYPVLFEEGQQMRDAVCAALAREDIFARKYFYPLTSEFSCYDGLSANSQAGTPVADRISRSVCTLPMYPDLTFAEAEEICAIVLRTIRHE